MRLTTTTKGRIVAMMTDKPVEQAATDAVSPNGAGQQQPTPGEKPASAATARGIQVTDRALVKIKAAMEKEGISPEQGGLRLGVQGGGCSGLTYNIRFDTQPRERDRIFQFGEVRVFVDPKSFIYLHGMTLDYQETLMQQSFVFVNPNASKSCGCGTSFS
jgi:iron-sulfur cluster assembly protein